MPKVGQIVISVGLAVGIAFGIYHCSSTYKPADYQHPMLRSGAVSP
jgi:hypothetical protein